MKTLNVILSILILILAIALAVSSYFLYEKREMMLNGWQKMSETINQTAAEMDKKSGTKLAETLTPEILHHTQYASMDENLKKLNAGAAALVKERDDLAAALINIGQTIEMNNLPGENMLTELATSQGATQEILAKVSEFRSRRDAVLNSVIRSGKIIGVNLNFNDLKGGDSAGVFRIFDNKLNAILTQMRDYEGLMRDVASVIGSATPNFDASAYRNSLSAIRNSVNDLKTKYNKVVSDLNAANAKIAELTNTVKQRDNQITTMNATIKTKETEVKQLKNVLGIGDGILPTPWTDGCKDARLAVRGKVIDLNDKFGFYVVDLGNNTRVEQPIGNKINKVSPKFENGMKMVVARNMDSADVKFVRRVKITNVADDCIIVEAAENGDQIKKGDDVCFFSEDLK